MTDAANTSMDKNSSESVIPAAAISAAFLLLLLDGGTSASTLLSAVAILLLSFIWMLRSSARATWPGFMMSLLMLTAFITIVPLPDAVLKVTGSESAAHHAAARSTLTQAHSAGLISSDPGWFQVSRNRAGTMRALLLLTMAVAAASLAVRLTTAQRRALITYVGLIASLVGVAGVISLHVLPQGKTFWWTIPVLHGAPVACFINRNHFGGILAAVAALMIGMACTAWSDRNHRASLFYTAAFLACSLSVAGSYSRGALLSLGCGILTAIIINIRKTPLAAVLLLVFLAAGSLTALSLLDRAGTIRARVSTIAHPLSSDSAQLRIATWKESAPILKNYPAFGTGLNAFRAVFPQHRVSTTRKEPNNVENEYIQIPVEAGIPGTILLLAAIVLFAVNLRPALTRNAADKDRSALFLPVFAVILAHCVVDFAVRIPLYTMTIAVFVGLSLSSRHEILNIRAKRTSLAVFLPVALMSFSLAAFSPSKTFGLDSPDYLNQATPDALADAIMSSPSYWHAYYNLGRIAAHSPELRGLAEEQISTASRLDPFNYNLLLTLARLRADMGLEKEALEAYRKAKSLRAWLSDPNLEQKLKQN